MCSDSATFKFCIRTNHLAISEWHSHSHAIWFLFQKTICRRTFARNKQLRNICSCHFYIRVVKLRHLFIHCVTVQRVAAIAKNYSLVTMATILHQQHLWCSLLTWEVYLTSVVNRRPWTSYCTSTPSVVVTTTWTLRHRDLCSTQLSHGDCEQWQSVTPLSSVNSHKVIKCLLRQ